MRNLNEISETEKEQIRLFSHEGTIGIGKLRELYSINSPRVVLSIIGKSDNKQDIKTEVNKVYHDEIAESQINYYIDCSRSKLNPLWKHDYETLANFPSVCYIANKRGELVHYKLFNTEGKEYTFMYSETILEALSKLEKGSIIHIDTYSKSLFQDLEKMGFIVCHKNKRRRTIQKGNKTVKKPYCSEVEHLASNVQKTIRRMDEQGKIEAKTLDRKTAFDLVKALIEIYHNNNKTNLLTWIMERTQQKIAIVQQVSRTQQ